MRTRQRKPKGFYQELSEDETESLNRTFVFTNNLNIEESLTEKWCTLFRKAGVFVRKRTQKGKNNIKKDNSNRKIIDK